MTYWGKLHEAGNKLFDSAITHVDDIAKREAREEVPKLFSEITSDTAKWLDESQNHAHVGKNESGITDCIFKPSDDHEDAKHFGKTYSNYVAEKYNEIINERLSNIKNSYTRKILQGELNEHGKHVIGRATKRELGLIQHKKMNDIGQTLENFSKNTYLDPSGYSKNKELCHEAINASLLPEDMKASLIKQTSVELSCNVAKSLMQKTPEAVLKECQNPQNWGKDLTVDQLDQFKNKAQQIIDRNKALDEQKMQEMLSSHFASIIKTGKGIPEVSQFFKSKDSYFASKEEAYIKAHETLNHLKEKPLSDWASELEKLTPKSGEKAFVTWEKTKAIVVNEARGMFEQASNDPAGFVQSHYSQEFENCNDFASKAKLSMQMQKEKDISKPRILTENQLEKYVHVLNSVSGENAHELQSHLKGLLSIGGDDHAISLQVVDEIIASNKLSPMIKVAIENMMQGNRVADDVIKAMSIEKRLFSEVSKEEKREFDRAFENNGAVQRQLRYMYPNQPELFTQEANNLRLTVKNLARYYQMQSNLSPKDAINKAAKHLIEENNITVNGIFIPSKLIDGTKLFKESISESLSNLKFKLVYEEEKYDDVVTFGKSQKGFEKEEQERVRDVMLDGQFVLWKDKKHLAYIVNVNGHVRYVMENRTTPKLFPLKDLNDPSNFKKSKKQKDIGFDTTELFMVR